MVSEGRRLEEQDRNADNNNFIIPYYRDVNDIDTDSSDESEQETESASESENDYETELERVMNLMIRIGDTISRIRSPTP